MEQDEIIWQNEVLEMARQAGFWKDLFAYPEFKDHLKAFAKLVADKERNEILDSFSPEEPIENWIDKILAREKA